MGDGRTQPVHTRLDILPQLDDVFHLGLIPTTQPQGNIHELRKADLWWDRLVGALLCIVLLIALGAEAKSMTLEQHALQRVEIFGVDSQVCKNHVHFRVLQQALEIIAPKVACATYVVRLQDGHQLGSERCGVCPLVLLLRGSRHDRAQNANEHVQQRQRADASIRHEHGGHHGRLRPEKRHGIRNSIQESSVQQKVPHGVANCSEFVLQVRMLLCLDLEDDCCDVQQNHEQN
mmetsp:Transcript_58746/g.151840  ORF Transcript_58746/g.151840 Transcript_58746/m.151840 type:complete len:233 (-) Transcript_58746:38-736(-)